MNTAPLKAYAPAARREFITAVSAQAARFGITSKGIESTKVDGDVLIIGGQAFPKAYAGPRSSLVNRVQSDGYDATMEAIAYTWFNRFVAIRYMELHDYLDHGYRVLSHPEGHNRPQILEFAAEIELLGLNKAKVVELKLDGTKDEELFRLILKAQCNALHRAMPFLFDPIGSETELLLPANLLHTDSLIRKLVNEIDESAWDHIEVIGWLYQFYISEKKDEVIGKVVKSEDIPAATQLFTPNWIVKYMVQNTLGAQWMATYPDSPLKDQMEFYIEPAEQTDEVKEEVKAITPSSLNPEEITFLDPACGSGHILVEAYDLFKAIYIERGYRRKDIPKLILEKNLFGLDIDKRAAQLSRFALLMKGRADDRRLFDKQLDCNILALLDSTGLDDKSIRLVVKLEEFGLTSDDLKVLQALFENTKTFGSLIQIPDGLVSKSLALAKLSQANIQDLFASDSLNSLKPLVKQLELLAKRYDVVVANPPYIGRKFHVPALKSFLKDQYEGYEKDVFSAFIHRNLSFTKPHGRLGFMSPFVWMFISSHEHLRTRLISKETISSLIQLEYSGFDGATVPICTFTVQQGHLDAQKGCYIRLSDFRGSENQAPKTLEAIQNRDCGWFFETCQDEFKKVPGNPVAYWISDQFRRVFEAGEALGGLAPVRQGLATANNARFMRFWPEVSLNKTGYGFESRKEAAESKMKWFPYNKGGEFRKWYGNNEFLVNWENDGQEIHSFKPRAVVRNPDFYFLPSVTWSFVSSAYFGVRYSDAGSVFDVGGSSAFPHATDHHWITGFLCSKQVFEFMKVMNPTLNFQVGNVATLPVFKDGLMENKPEIDKVVGHLIDVARKDWDAYERSWNFSHLPFMPDSLGSAFTLEQSYSNWVSINKTSIEEVRLSEKRNNELFLNAYGLQEELAAEISTAQVTLTVNPAYRYGGDLSEEEQWVRFREDTMKELISYSVGCMMGRYGLDEPGLIYAHSGNEGFDHKRYSTFPADDDGIVPLTDTNWFEDDACNRVVEFISVVWDKEKIEENLTFLAESLSSKKNETSRDTIRRYLCNSFFKDHLKMYKNRPIYWLFSSGKKKAFQCLVYLHRYNEGTLARMRSEYVIPLQGKLAARIEKLGADITKASSTAHRKKLEKEKSKLEKQNIELLAFDEKLRHYADQRIALDLDDGVKVNYGKFGSLLADAKAIHGKKPEGL